MLHIKVRSTRHPYSKSGFSSLTAFISRISLVFLLQLRAHQLDTKNTSLKNFNFKLLLKLLDYVKPYRHMFIGTIFVSILFAHFWPFLP